VETRQSGFENGIRFDKDFKALVGKTPVAYARAAGTPS
jgi:hypothetical protein